MSDPIEDRLRDVLTRVVPEPPDRLVVEPGRPRSHRRVVAVGAAALVAAAVLVPVLATRDSSPAPEPAPVTSAPYDAAACPTPSRPTATSLPELDGIASVRLCVGSGYLRKDPILRAPAVVSVPADALVDGLARFVSDVQALPTVGPDLCATINYVHDGSTLQVTFTDGRSVRVTTSPCEGVGVGHISVRADGLGVAFLDALDRQRDSSSYRRDVPTPTCDAAATIAPVDPGRDDVVAAVSCPGDVHVTGDRLDRLRGAWRVAAPLTGELDCKDAATRASVVVTTTRGDTVRLTDEGCGYLAFRDPRDGERQALQLQPEALRPN